MAVTEGNYHLYFDVRTLSNEELNIFNTLIAERKTQHEQSPDRWGQVDWIHKVKAPKYEAHLDGANSDDVVYDIKSFLFDVKQALPTLKAHGWGSVDYVMDGGSLEFEFSLSNSKLDWEETDTYDADDGWDEWEDYEADNE